MDALALEQAAREFGRALDATKAGLTPDFGWYPYGTLTNFAHLRPLLEQFPLDTLLAGRRTADIGAADGDLAFFLESLGYEADIIDHPPTNFNSLRGARLLAQTLKSSVVIHDIDLDSYFALPQERYDLVFFLGILYHLKNPFYVMEHLAKSARHLLVSTRIARFAPAGGGLGPFRSGGQKLRDIPVAYLLGPAEANNDATNFWIFSEAGLVRLFERTGWEVLAWHTVGDTRHSDPARQDRDERAFALLRSRE